MFFLIWSIVLFTILYMCYKRKFSHFKEKNINHVTIIEGMYIFFKTICKRTHMVTGFETPYKKFPNDRFVGSYDFMTQSVTIRDPELIKKVGVKDFDHFTNHRSVTDQEDFIFSKSLFALKDQKWRDMRATLSPAFTGSKLRNMVPLITECSKDILDDLHRQINEKAEKYHDVDTLDLLSRYTNDVIATCAFGLKINSVKERENTFYVMGRKLTTFKFKQVVQFMLMLMLPFLTKIKRIDFLSKDAIDFLRHIVLKTLKDREENQLYRPDLIQLLLEAKKGTLKHENVKDEKDAGFATVQESDIGKNDIKHGWDDDHLVGQAFLFFIAGFDTVSTTLTFLLYELATHIEVQEKLRSEIDDHYEANDGKLLYENIIHMKYLDMVVSESLRKWPPSLGTDRVCNKPYNLGKQNETSTEDYILQKDSVILVSFWALHRDPKYYENPDKFDPERFSDENKHKIKPFTYLPFGIGPRNCIGSRFALMEIKMFLYGLLRRFEVSPAPQTVIPPKLVLGSFVLRLEGGHTLRFKCRT